MDRFLRGQGALALDPSKFYVALGGSRLPRVWTACSEATNTTAAISDGVVAEVLSKVAIGIMSLGIVDVLGACSSSFPVSSSLPSLGLPPAVSR